MNSQIADPNHVTVGVREHERHGGVGLFFRAKSVHSSLSAVQERAQLSPEGCRQ